MSAAAHIEIRRGAHLISTDPRRIDLEVVHGYLSRSYWAEGVPREIVERSIENSMCFGVYRVDGAASRQVGFARVVTDRATFAWIADVFVLEEERGQGLAKWLMQVVRDHPELQRLRRWVLATRDAHALYAQTGFVPPAHPERYMERRDAASYRAL